MQSSISSDWLQAQGYPRLTWLTDHWSVCLWDFSRLLDLRLDRLCPRYSLRRTRPRTAASLWPRKTIACPSGRFLDQTGLSSQQDNHHGHRLSLSRHYRRDPSIAWPGLLQWRRTCGCSQQSGASGHWSAPCASVESTCSSRSSAICLTQTSASAVLSQTSSLSRLEPCIGRIWDSSFWSSNRATGAA